MQKFEGKIVDVLSGRIFPGEIRVENGKIAEIKETATDVSDYIMPGFVDAHVHIESSMITPELFGRVAAKHGTVAAVCDPHEIANVLGREGLRFMLESGKKSPIPLFFSVPSCVPATPFETSGACLEAEDIEELFSEYPRLKFLGEMMNFPGITAEVPEVIAKTELARRLGKKIDGHAPGLTGNALKKYIAAGIDTDHECRTLEEAREKIELGMKIWIREGSAAKDLDALLPLLDKHYRMCGFCSDDKHPDDLIRSHIDEHLRRAVAAGIDPLKALYCACVSPVLHYGLEVGLLQEGDSADFVIADNLENFGIKDNFIAGKSVIKYEVYQHSPIVACPNNFACLPKQPDDFKLPNREMPVIQAYDGELFTGKKQYVPNNTNEFFQADTDNDILKIAVVNRYKNQALALGLVCGFGLKRGSTASSIAHDSHNIVAVGTDDMSIANAVNAIIETKGGIAACDAETGDTEVFPLPIAGLMSDKSVREAAEAYTRLTNTAKRYGSRLSAPFMTLSFMALPVIPRLKIIDGGLFDVERFEFVSD